MIKYIKFIHIYINHGLLSRKKKIHIFILFVKLINENCEEFPLILQE